MNFRLLEIGDYHKNYLHLLSVLTDVGTWTYEEFATHLMAIHQNPFLEIWIGYEPSSPDNILASGTILWEPKIIHGGQWVAHIEDIVISKESQGKGYGKSLMEFLIHRSQTKPIYKVILDCNDSNIPFYQKCGFKLKNNQMEYRFS